MTIFLQPQGIRMRTCWLLRLLAAFCVTTSISFAQQVILPAPRLLTTMPMGGQSGSTFEVTVTSESLDDAYELLFSHPGITARAKTKPDGTREKNQFVVTVAPDVPQGVYEARALARLGISACRAFSVGPLPETTRQKANTTLESALELKLNSVCNATTTARSVDHYSFHAVKGQRIFIECAAAGIDSKLIPVLIVADEKGRDLVVERRAGSIDFTAPADGLYVIKVHSLTFQGGTEHFYRLVLRDVLSQELPDAQPTTQMANSVSIPAPGKFGPVLDELPTSQKKPNPKNVVQKISLPCEINGRFFPAADVDVFEFSAKKSEVWWVEVVSERLGLPTDPFVVVQRVTQEGNQENLADVAEMNDIASPMKLSSNGYAYDGVHVNLGSSDALGRLEIKEDGIYRLQVRDLFGGTRSDPRNRYRLIIRKASPDFALAAWGMHMVLRNGDRNAVSKPLALRPGGTMALDVAVVRKDGFDGAIEIGMRDLPEGVSACGLNIPAGKSSGTLLVTAAPNAKRGWTIGQIIGRAEINGEPQERICALASLIWPVRDAKQEIPRSRRMGDVPVSVNGEEPAPVTVAPSEEKIWEARVGETLKIPLDLTWRGEFSGAFKLTPLGAGFEKVKGLEIPLNAPKAELLLDLADLKIPPGDHVLAMHGGVVTKYRYHVAAVTAAEVAVKQADEQLKSATTRAMTLAQEASTAPAEEKTGKQAQAAAAMKEQKQAESAKAEAERQLKAATAAAQPVDIADIIVSTPIRIRVLPAEKK
jgi:hypothetical protein